MENTVLAQPGQATLPSLPAQVGGLSRTAVLPGTWVVSESRVTWATSVPILVFLGLSVLDLEEYLFRQK